MRSKLKINAELVVPVGYVLEDLLDIDDSGYDFEEAILQEEVRVNFEKDG